VLDLRSPCDRCKDHVKATCIDTVAKPCLVQDERHYKRNLFICDQDPNPVSQGKCRQAAWDILVSERNGCWAKEDACYNLKWPIICKKKCNG
jgi:hypothetical protein